MTRLPFGVAQLDPVLGGGAPGGNVVLAAGEAGAGAREFAYTSAVMNALADADPDLFDLYYGDLDPAATIPPEVHYLSFTADRERRRAAADDPFESMDVPEFNGDPWADLNGEGADPFAGDAVRTGGAAGDRPEHVVSKRGYCQQCPHVSDPPALSCTHEGGEIVEVLDDGMLRVRGCPMVDEADGRGE